MKCERVARDEKRGWFLGRWDSSRRTERRTNGQVIQVELQATREELDVGARAQAGWREGVWGLTWVGFGWKMIIGVDVSGCRPEWVTRSLGAAKSSAPLPPDCAARPFPPREGERRGAGQEERRG